MTAHISVTAKPILMKLETKNYHLKSEDHSRMSVNHMGGRVLHQNLERGVTNQIIPLYFVVC